MSKLSTACIVRRLLLALPLVPALLLCPSAPLMAEPPSLLIDDFSRADGLSALDTRWQGFSDRVMGGRSEFQAALAPQAGGGVLTLRGRVRLENQGGFIQVRLPLSASGRFDAGEWRALRLSLRGRPGPYYLHLRSADTRLPWQYYRAPLTVTADWQDVEVPLADFLPQALRTPMDVSRLSSLGLVAYGEAFDAELQVRRIEWVQ